MSQQIRENVVSLFFTLICLALYFYFPIGDLRFEIFLGAACFLFLLPVLYTKYILKKNLETIGFGSFSINMRDTFILILALVLGGVASFFIISFYNLGVESYSNILSRAVFGNFGAFLVYEILFSAVFLFLITFFIWGFMYSVELYNHLYTKIVSFVIFVVMLLNFYESFWIILPMLIPVLFVKYIRDKKNILYLFSVIFVNNLFIDTLVIKLFS